MPRLYCRGHEVIFVFMTSWAGLSLSLLPDVEGYAEVFDFGIGDGVELAHGGCHDEGAGAELGYLQLVEGVEQRVARDNDGVVGQEGTGEVRERLGNGV